jgi:hypothetical protein
MGTWATQFASCDVEEEYWDESQEPLLPFKIFNRKVPPATACNHEVQKESARARILKELKSRQPIYATRISECMRNMELPELQQLLDQPEELASKIAEALKTIAGDHQTQTFTKCFGCNDKNGPINSQCIHCGERIVSIDSADNFACSYCNTSCTVEAEKATCTTCNREMDRFRDGLGEHAARKWVPATPDEPCRPAKCFTCGGNDGSIGKDCTFCGSLVVGANDNYVCTKCNASCRNETFEETCKNCNTNGYMEKISDQLSGNDWTDRGRTPQTTMNPPKHISPENPGIRLSNQFAELDSDSDEEELTPRLSAKKLGKQKRAVALENKKTSNTERVSGRTDQESLAEALVQGSMSTQNACSIEKALAQDGDTTNQLALQKQILETCQQNRQENDEHKISANGGGPSEQIAHVTGSSSKRIKAALDADGLGHLSQTEQIAMQESLLNEANSPGCKDAPLDLDKEEEEEVKEAKPGATRYNNPDAGKFSDLARACSHDDCCKMPSAKPRICWSEGCEETVHHACFIEATGTPRNPDGTWIRDYFEILLPTTPPSSGEKAEHFRQEIQELYIEWCDNVGQSKSLCPRCAAREFSVYWLDNPRPQKLAPSAMKSQLELEESESGDEITNLTGAGFEDLSDTELVEEEPEQARQRSPKRAGRTEHSSSSSDELEKSVITLPPKKKKKKKKKKKMAKSSDEDHPDVNNSSSSRIKEAL